jgi:hypothetical protein
MTLHHVSNAADTTTTCGRFVRLHVACTGFWECVTCKWCLRRAPSRGERG